MLWLVKVFISSDMEGTAGIVDWAQCRGPGAEYERGRALLLAEVNAAIDGAVGAGATSILVNDSHGAMANLGPESLHGRAAYLSGRHKPFYMMEGLNDSFAAACFVSYHGSMGSPGVLSHTYNPRAIAAVRIGGIVTGESGINALVAAAHRVPVAVITGDQIVGPEAEPFCPGIEVVQVKHAVNRFAALSVHPEQARELIRVGTERAVRRATEIGPPHFSPPISMEVDFLTADMAELATWIREVNRTADRTVTITGENPLRVFRTFITVVSLTRSLVE